MSLPIAILIVGMAQAMILSLVILHKKEKRKYPLLMLLSIIGLGLGMRIAYSPGFYAQWVKIVQLSDISLLLFGPAFWFFFKSSIAPVKKKDWKALGMHGIPAILFLVHFSIMILPVSNREFILAEAQGFYDLYYSILLGLGIILNSAYWWFSFRMFNSSYRGSAQSKIFLRLVLAVNALAIVAWATGFVLSFIGAQWYAWLNMTYQLSFVALATSSIVISYYALSQSNFWIEKAKTRKYAKSKLSQNDIIEIGTRLEVYLKEEKKYLDPDFTLDDLSKGIKVNKVQLSQVINQYFNKGFADWINEHRVEEFIKNVKSGAYEHLTLVGIAMESGFNTKATFNKAFKKAKGTTPSLFLGKKREKAVPVLGQ